MGTGWWVGGPTVTGGVARIAGVAYISAWRWKKTELYSAQGLNSFFKKKLIPNIHRLPLILFISLIPIDIYNNVICNFTFILWCVWGLLFVTCQPIIPWPTALLIVLSLDVASSCCKMGMWLALTLPQPTSHCITAPGCVGFFTSPVSDTNKSVKTWTYCFLFCLWPIEKHFNVQSEIVWLSLFLV